MSLPAISTKVMFAVLNGDPIFRFSCVFFVTTITSGRQFRLSERVKVENLLGSFAEEFFFSFDLVPFEFDE